MKSRECHAAAFPLSQAMPRESNQELNMSVFIYK